MVARPADGRSRDPAQPERPHPAAAPAIVSSDGTGGGTYWFCDYSAAARRSLANLDQHTARLPWA